MVLAVMLIVMRVVARNARGVAMRLARIRLLERGSAAQSFAGEQFDRLAFGRNDRRRRAGGVLVPVAMIVVFEIFEDIAHVEKRVTIQANVHESGLHAG